jgi:hypothetical protein
MYTSYFSYNLTRPYPFRWFTCVVVLGGIVATTFVSIFNFAANGYLLRYGLDLVFRLSPNVDQERYTRQTQTVPLPNPTGTPGHHGRWQTR